MEECGDIVGRNGELEPNGAADMESGAAESKLRDCPFCGGYPTSELSGNGWKIICYGCGIKTPDFYGIEDDAVGFWNGTEV